MALMVLKVKERQRVSWHLWMEGKFFLFELVRQGQVAHLKTLEKEGKRNLTHYVSKLEEHLKRVEDMKEKMQHLEQLVEVMNHRFRQWHYHTGITILQLLDY